MPSSPSISRGVLLLSYRISYSDGLLPNFRFVDYILSVAVECVNNTICDFCRLDRINGRYDCGGFWCASKLPLTMGFYIHQLYINFEIGMIVVKKFSQLGGVTVVGGVIRGLWPYLLEVIRKMADSCASVSLAKSAGKAIKQPESIGIVSLFRPVCLSVCS
ncbi:hypothetical protein CTI12_AA045920 [Artemisia annua]|uniref:Uncharacterized protein n=1 Tax=Artemisia annua TaxID=35608 RepID=A0A2U1PXU1_ARTAN|nr:hypothetical protein CTI12_AA045920 [Artemisia annua]